MVKCNCYVLTWILVSQETGKVDWYSYVFKNFPQFVVNYTFQAISRDNEADVDYFIDFPCFFYYQNTN